MVKDYNKLFNHILFYIHFMVHPGLRPDSLLQKIQNLQFFKQLKNDNNTNFVSDNRCYDTKFFNVDIAFTKIVD